jgi:hypothetical protein
VTQQVCDGFSDDISPRTSKVPDSEVIRTSCTRTGCSTSASGSCARIAVLEEILDMVLVREELGAEEIVIPIVCEMAELATARAEMTATLKAVWRCDICQKMFTSRHGLTNHKRRSMRNPAYAKFATSLSPAL